jgi:Holliday junction resolvase RusA-like endonuclease
MAAPRARNITVTDIDAMIVGVEHPTLYITVAVAPPVQERPRFTMYTTNGVHRIRTYDPSSRGKRAFKDAIRQALSDLGVSTFPFFRHKTHVKISGTYAVSNEAKDIDNLQKFLSDSLKGVVYSDDRWVYHEDIKKKGAPINSQFVEISVQEVAEIL